MVNNQNRSSALETRSLNDVLIGEPSGYHADGGVEFGAVSIVVNS
jgi:hypothetical protein